MVINRDLMVIYPCYLGAQDWPMPIWDCQVWASWPPRARAPTVPWRFGDPGDSIWSERRHLESHGIFSCTLIYWWLWNFILNQKIGFIDFIDLCVFKKTLNYWWLCIASNCFEVLCGFTIFYRKVSNSAIATAQAMCRGICPSFRANVWTSRCSRAQQNLAKFHMIFEDDTCQYIRDYSQL